MLKILQCLNRTKNMDRTKKAHIIKPGKAEEKSFIFDPQALYSVDSFWLLTLHAINTNLRGAKTRFWSH